MFLVGAAVTMFRIGLHLEELMNQWCFCELALAAGCRSISGFSVISHDCLR